MDTLEAVINIIAGAIGFGLDNPGIVGFAVTAVFVFLIVRAIRRHLPVQTDQQRMFTPSQRAETKRLAGGRCEHSNMGFRCRAPGAHADHIYPWSRGGATSMSNMQSLCATHNLRKSAKIPSHFYIHQLEKRRAKYFPQDANPKVEWRIGAFR